MSDPKQLVESIIADKKVAVFAKSWCGYCRKTKQTLAKYPLGDKIEIIDIDLRDDEDEIQGYLANKTGQTSVPNIFIGQKHIGGNSDLQELVTSGELDKLLK